MNCGLVYQSPRMTVAELDNFYKKEYRRVYQNDDGPISHDLSVQKARATNLINMLAESGVKKIYRHLDVGSSSGMLLEKMGDEYQCQSVGIEPGDAYRIYAEKRGLQVYPSLEAAEEEQPFDLITMVHVLEHIPQPVAYLAELQKRYLADDGWLLIEVPNLYAHDSFEVAHLVAFSRHSLSQLVMQAGYSIRYLQVHGLPRSNMIPLYITMLASSNDQMINKPEIRKERWTGLKRRSGMTHRKIIERVFPQHAWLPAYRS
jgi:2-polyprenyl-3-methyl-5-hydroxy-6-metoxy-1,4-benzoquinol methylase